MSRSAYLLDDICTLFRAGQRVALVHCRFRCNTSGSERHKVEGWIDVVEGSIPSCYSQAFTIQLITGEEFTGSLIGQDEGRFVFQGRRFVL